MSVDHSLDIAVFIHDIIVCFDRSPAMRAGGVHADDVDAVAVFAGFLVDEFLIADFCLRVIFFFDWMEVHGKDNHTDKDYFKDNTAGTRNRIKVPLHDNGSQIIKRLGDCLVHGILIPLQKILMKIIGEKTRFFASEDGVGIVALHTFPVPVIETVLLYFCRIDNLKIEDWTI